MAVSVGVIADHRGPVLLGALALALRLVFLVLAGVNAPLVGDELAYQQIAANVAAGRGFVQNNNPFFPGQVLYAWQAPLYPLSLAALYIFFSPHPIIAKLSGILIGVATVYVTFDLARRLFYPPERSAGSSGGTSEIDRLRETRPEESQRALAQDNKRGKPVALLAALFVAIYPGLLTNAHLLLSETLFTFLLMLAFDLIAAAMDKSPVESDGGDPNSRFKKVTSSLPPLALSGRGRILLIAAAGATWGAATLTRGITLYFLAPLALWLVFGKTPLIRLDGEGKMLNHKRLPAGLNLKMPIVFAVAMLVVIAPWTIRNFAVFHQIVLLETKGGVNFWLGNSPDTPRDFIRNVWKADVRGPMLTALPADETARDRAGYALGETFIARQPLTFITRMPVKFADFWGFERSLVDAAEATRNGKAGGWNSPAKIAADFLSDAAYVILVLLAVGGLVFAKDDRWKLLIGGFIFYIVFVHMVVFGDGRFHLPLIPFLALYAAWFTVNRGQVGSRWSLRGVLALSLALVFAGVWLYEIAAAWEMLRGAL